MKHAHEAIRERAPEEWGGQVKGRAFRVINVATPVDTARSWELDHSTQETRERSHTPAADVDFTPAKCPHILACREHREKCRSRVLSHPGRGGRSCPRRQRAEIMRTDTGLLSQPRQCPVDLLEGIFNRI